MLAYNPNAAQITALALQYGLVSPYTSMVAIGDEVVVQGGTRRSVAVPVSVPAGMKWQAVKKETTVDTASKQEEKLVEKPGRTAVDKDYRQNVPKNAKRPVPQPSPEPKPAPRGGAADEDDDRPGTLSVPLLPHKHSRN